MNTDDKTLDAQMEHLLNQLEIEKAPASLTRRLKQIPREHRENKASAAVAVSRSPAQVGDGPGICGGAIDPGSCRHDAADASRHRQKSNRRARTWRWPLPTWTRSVYRTGNQIQSVLGGELRHSVKDKLSEHIPFTEQSIQEETS